MTSTTYQCPDCRRAELFEQPVDERVTNELDNPEWACTVCGAALVVDPVLAVATATDEVLARSA